LTCRSGALPIGPVILAGCNNCGAGRVYRGLKETRVTFEEFAEARLHALLRYAIMLTGDRELGQDIVQDVMIRAHGRWSHIENRDMPER
jgi:DNA-directed RNA polymerase specialized sigma24 family protein